MQHRFYKNEEDRWFIDLPAYLESGGKLNDLEMVRGADDMLDYLAKGSNEVVLQIEVGGYNKIRFDLGGQGYSLLTFAGLEDGGANYEAVALRDQDAKDFELWLCSVTKFVFGHFPEIIYVKRIN